MLTKQQCQSTEGNLEHLCLPGTILTDLYSSAIRSQLQRPCSQAVH